MADKIPGGLADKKKPSDFDSKALAKGKNVEMEHTDDPAVAREIAMDHLTEDPKYYDKLETIEKHGDITMTLRQATIKLAQENPELRVHLLPILRQAADGEEDDSSGSAKKPSGKMIQFIEEEGDTKVTNPDTGNKVKIKSLKGDRGGKFQKDLFQKWLKAQEKKEKPLPLEKSKGDDKKDEKKPEKKDKGDDKKAPIKVPSALGDLLGQWHSSGGDPIYAVSSSASGGHEVPHDTMQKALDSVTEMIDQANMGMHGWDKDDAKQLTKAKKVMEKSLKKKASGMNLRQAVVKLAYENPELRAHLLPILCRTAEDGKA